MSGSTNLDNTTGLRILAFGKEAATAAKLEEQLRSLGYHATCFALTNDVEGDARLRAELASQEWDGISIGSFISGQGIPATEERTRWFNRVLNIIHLHAPNAKFILPHGPTDVAAALQRELGPRG